MRRFINNKKTVFIGVTTDKKQIKIRILFLKN